MRDHKHLLQAVKGEKLDRYFMVFFSLFFSFPLNRYHTYPSVPYDVKSNIQPNWILATKISTMPESASKHKIIHETVCDW